MNNPSFFEIPNDSEIMAQLIEPIPTNWSCVSGKLVAPKSFFKLGRASEGTGYCLNSHYEYRVVSDNHLGEPQKEFNPFALLVGLKYPGFVRFDGAGRHAKNDSLVTLQRAKEIAQGFLRTGYRGSLWFNKENHHMDIQAKVEIDFQPWRGQFNDEPGDQPARIRLQWNSNYGGGGDNVIAVADLCETLGLHQYQPTKQFSPPTRVGLNLHPA